MENYSSLPNIKISYYLKVQIPKMHRQFFRIICQNTKYVDNFCQDLYNPLLFASREWIFEKSSKKFRHIPIIQSNFQCKFCNSMWFFNIL